MGYLGSGCCQAFNQLFFLFCGQIPALPLSIDMYGILFV